MKKRALVILAEGFEEIEAVTPIDILRRADIEVIVAGLHTNERFVKGSRGVTIKTDIALANLDTDFDACILPGGMPGSSNLAGSDLVRSLILNMNRDKKIIAAICAAPALVLAPASILDNKKATCFPGMETSFNASTTFVRDDVVVDQNIITSRGAGTALKFSLKIVEKLAGKDMAETIKQKVVANNL